MTSTATKPAPYPTLAPTLLLISTKAYFTPSRTLSYLESLLDPKNGIIPLPPSSDPSSKAPPSLQLALLPDHLTIHPCASMLANQPTSTRDPTTWPLLLGAQNCSSHPHPGSYTGEIVPSSLQALGCRIVALGHAERRLHLSETDETTAKKAAAVCACGMIPLLCVGERRPAPRREGPLSMAVGNALAEIGPQVRTVLEAVPGDAPVIVAYEPVWAIGKEEAAGVEYVGVVVEGIRGMVRGVEGRTGETRVVYGGSAGVGLWGEGGLGEVVDGMFLGRFAHEIGGVKLVVDEVLETIRQREREREGKS